jgi:inositol polyphosphate 5-phosphatase INPP5B/F
VAPPTVLPAPWTARDGSETKLERDQQATRHVPRNDAALALAARAVPPPRPPPLAAPMAGWVAEGEALADELWGAADDDDDTMRLDATARSCAAGAHGTSLSATPRSQRQVAVLDEFRAVDDSAVRRLEAAERAAAAVAVGEMRRVDGGEGGGPGSFVLRSGRDRAGAASPVREGALPIAAGGIDGSGDGDDVGLEDEARDLDVIGRSLGLTLDEESAMLQTAPGRREWIRKEMVRRERLFTQLRSLSIKTGTWNVNGRPPMVALEAWLLPDGGGPEAGADVYLIGLQEVQPLSGMSAVTTDTSRGVLWKNAIEAALDSPQTYVTIAARQMVGILVVALVKRCHEPYVRDVMISDVGTGFMRSGGNKGGVACRFALYDKTVCCVSCHLAAHEPNIERRNQDFHDILRRLVFRPEPDAPVEPSPFSYLEYNAPSRAGGSADAPGALNKNGEVERSSGWMPAVGGGAGSEESAGKQQDVPVAAAATGMSLLEHDVVFWVGDLNYRVQLGTDAVMVLIEKEAWGELQKYDQLHNARMSGEVFQGFEEGQIDFAPTYKLSRESEHYERKEMDGEMKVSRTPSWTDRVLWRDRVRSSRRSAAGRSASIPSGRRSFGLGMGTFNRFRRQSSPKSGGVRLVYYGRSGLLSSDHRPVTADFSLDFRIINIKSRNDTVRRIHNELARREAALRPLLSVSATSVDLGAISYGEVARNAQHPFSLRNEGRVTAFISVMTTEFPTWLNLDSKVSRSEYKLAPGQSVDIVFLASIDARMGVSTALSMGTETLRTVARVVIQNQREFRLPVYGCYVPTCLGMTLLQLASCIEPIAKRQFKKDSADTVESTDAATPSDTSAPGAEQVSPSPEAVVVSKVNGVARCRVGPPLPVPKEIWRLVDFLLAKLRLPEPAQSCKGSSMDEPDGNLDARSLFAQQTDTESAAAVLKCIDTGEPISGSTPPAAVAACLLNILRCLEEPVIPRRCNADCAKVGASDVGSLSNDDVFAALADAAPVSRNTLTYIAAFLAALPGPCKAKEKADKNRSAARYYRAGRFGWELDGCMAPFALARIFAPLCFDMSGADDEGEFGGYICHLMYAASKGPIRATFSFR